MATSKKSTTAPVAAHTVSVTAADKAAQKAAKIAALSATLTQKQAAPKPQMSTAPAEKPFVSSRATWSGIVLFGSVPIPAKALKATEEEKVAFNQIHHCNAADTDAKAVYTQLKQQGMMCPTCDEEVSKDAILKGYKHTDGTFVTVSEDEKKACLVGKDNQMVIDSFVPFTSIDPIYFADAEYLIPGEGGAQIFSTLREAMVSTGKVAIATTAQRGREQTVVLRPFGVAGIVAHYLFFDNEVRQCDKWQSVAVDPLHLKASIDLIEALSDTFDATAYEDGSMRRIKGMLNDKVAGRAVTAPAAAPVVSAPTMSIMDMLTASLAAPVKKSKKALVAA
jgi:DNA end-binding protein Ku